MPYQAKSTCGIKMVLRILEGREKGTPSYRCEPGPSVPNILLELGQTDIWDHSDITETIPQLSFNGKYSLPNTKTTQVQKVQYFTELQA